MMLARQHMKQRTKIERLRSTGTEDEYGHPVLQWESLASYDSGTGYDSGFFYDTYLPCAYWNARSLSSDAEHRIIAAYTQTMMVPIGSNVQEGDRANTIFEADGTIIISSTLRVNTVVRRRTHLELELSQYE